VKFFSALYVGGVGLKALFFSESVFGAIFSIIGGLLMPILAFVALLVGFAGVMVAWSRLYAPEEPVDMDKFIEFHDPILREQYANTTMPIYYAVEAYMAQQIDFKMDFYTLMANHRRDIFRMVFCKEHVEFFFKKLMPQAFYHSKHMDNGEIAHVYDRGNDFYNWFLGDSMVYTSGIFESPEDTLEEAQKRKMDKICNLLQLNKDQEMEMLDIGCGWGSLACHAAKHFNANAYGISLAQEQVNYGMQQAVEMKVEDKVELRVQDYRLLSEKQYDAISCVEMSEHVGVWRYHEFLQLVKDRLKDDGLFYLQIAGLRRAWQFEDLIWGIFMGTYIFPAADASCPLGWVISQLEAAGFEIRSSETVGIHYSWTIKRWYNNWLSNRDAVVAAYGEYWYRLWVVFLAWSTIIAEQGSSTCFQIVAHKNKDEFDRTRFIGSD
jgi:cyclopropane fatty-acyl-phospholipid synthase-like methyltransferase